MRLHKTLSLALISLLPALATPADALQVVIRTIVGEGENQVVTETPNLGPGSRTSDGTITITTVNITDQSVGGFFITCSLCPDPATVVAEQSGGLERITVNNTTIFSPDPCAAPCAIEIIATSDTEVMNRDFPNPKSPGGQPAGVIMSGFFLPGFSPTAPEGDAISVTGRAGGTNTDGSPRGVEVINAVAGTGPGNTTTSLASECTGDPGCTFTATAFESSFSDQISETIQFKCPTSNPCTPFLEVTTRVTFAANPGDSVDLPVGAAQSRDGSAEPLREALVPAPGSLTVEKAVVKKLSEFAMTSKFILDQASNGINPPKEIVLFKFGPSFSVAVPAGNCKPRKGGKIFVCGVKLSGGGSFGSVFEKLDDAGTSWRFSAGALGANLTGTVNPVRVELNVVPVTAGGADGSATQATAQFFD